MPSSGFGEIVVVSGTHVPPDTTITRGPRNGAEVRGQPIFDFTGSDDVVSPNDLTFECSVDADEWSSCESPLAGVIEDGWHTLRIRALDDMLNVDPTPAARSWRIDTKAPSRPSVRAPRPATRGTVYRFSSTDRGTSSHRLRFRCAIDTRRLHACASRYRLQLPPGRHVLRVRAVDPAGNESGTTTVRLVIRLRQSALGR
jgi:large repetitive protein